MVYGLQKVYWTRNLAPCPLITRNLIVMFLIINERDVKNKSWYWVISWVHGVNFCGKYFCGNLIFVREILWIVKIKRKYLVERHVFSFLKSCIMKVLALIPYPWSLIPDQLPSGIPWGRDWLAREELSNFPRCLLGFISKQILHVSHHLARSVPSIIDSKTCSFPRSCLLNEILPKNEFNIQYCESELFNSPTCLFLLRALCIWMRPLVKSDPHRSEGILVNIKALWYRHSYLHLLRRLKNLAKTWTRLFTTL